MKSTSDHVSLPVLAQKLEISFEKLLLAIDAQQMPVCIKMRPDIDSKLSERHRSDKMDDLLKSNPGIFPKAHLFPSRLPQHICVPIFNNYIDQLLANPAAIMNTRYICKITDGKLIPYDLWRTPVYLNIANFVLLKEHEKQLIQKIKGGSHDLPLMNGRHGVCDMTRKNCMGILRLPDVMRQLGYRAHASVYNAINDGLFTKPVAIGVRSVGWPEEEVEQIYRARIAGFTTEQLKKLVSNLHSNRISAANVETIGRDA